MLRRDPAAVDNPLPPSRVPAGQQKSLFPATSSQADGSFNLDQQCEPVAFLRVAKP
jgi:hypothetical protein